MPAAAMTAWLLAAAGPVTALPLLLFAARARGISFSTPGMPLIGVLLHGEPFGYARGRLRAHPAGLATYTAAGMYRSLRYQARAG